VLVRPTGEGERILVEGRRRRIEELAGLSRDLSPDELELLGHAAAIVERGIARPPSA
jgi:hypothetical protein